MVQKDYILAEIARTARENGGEPLGVKRFYNETGIKQNDWAGRYWVRWSDAIIEAGFPANQLQAALSDDFMLEKVASLVRQLGHFPVKNALLMHRRTDDALPHHATLVRRFGNRRKLAEKVVEYCENAGGCEDIIAICRRLCDGGSKIPQRLGSASLVILGDVYLLKCGRFYKLGHSNASGRRERELAIQLPEKSKIATSSSEEKFSMNPPTLEWVQKAEVDFAKEKRTRAAAVCRPGPLTVKKWLWPVVGICCRHTRATGS